MRIHSLTMAGIGPYGGTETIDFDAFGDSGRFLLTGPTGSGKTTIIDAIVFALYGDVADSADSSKERIRSTLVGPEVESVVDLVISTTAGVYRVRRTPTYERAKKRGQGTTTQHGSIKLWRLSAVGGEPLGEPVTRVGEADAEIARIIGLRREQFTQTVVLPQGKFAQFLRADSTQRQGLLRDVFGTGLYDAIQAALAESSRAGAKAVEEAAGSLRVRAGALAHEPLLTTPIGPEEDDGEEQHGQEDDGEPAAPPQEELDLGLPPGGSERAPEPNLELDSELDAERGTEKGTELAPEMGPERCVGQVLEAAVAPAVPDLEALRQAIGEARRISTRAVERAREQAAATAERLARARQDQEEARSLHERLERRRALIAQQQELQERAEQDAQEAERLHAAERAERAALALRAGQVARERAASALSTLEALASLKSPGPLGSLTDPADDTALDPALDPRLDPALTGSEAPPRSPQPEAAQDTQKETQQETRALVEPLQARARQWFEALTEGRMAGQAQDPSTPPAGRPEAGHPEDLETLPLDERAHQLRGEHGRLSELVAREAALDSLSQALDTREQEMARAAQGQERRGEQLAARPGERAELAASLEEARAARERAPGLEGEYRRAQDQHLAASAVVALSAELARHEEALTQAAEQAATAAKAVQRTRMRWISSEAGALAGELQEGEPCPVCGSEDHPRPAAQSDQGATRAQVEAAERAQHQADEALHTARQERDSCQERREDQQRASGGLDPEGSAAALAEARAAVEAARALAERAPALEEQLADFDAATERLRTGHERARSDLAVLRSRLEDERDQLAQERERCEQARGPWPSVADRAAALAEHARDLEAASRAVSQAAAALSALEEARAQEAQALAEQGFHSAEQALAAALDPQDRAAISERVAQVRAARERVRLGLADPQIAALSGQEDDGLDQALAALAEAEAAHGQTSARHARATEAHEHLERSCAGVEQSAAAYEAAVGASAALLRVAALARGDNPTGTTLSTWVLQSRFDEVLVFANERLAQMSSGRYELTRVGGESGSRARRKGLGLSVIDHLGAEHQRDPKTLSGGETFYVSLCLALALADVVSAESGGVSLETLFIDEGFGSLDPETLQVVMTEIEHLRAGGRTVGIVSHVDELKSQIPDQIRIHRSASGGSTLRLTP